MGTTRLRLRGVLDFQLGNRMSIAPPPLPLDQWNSGSAIQAQDLMLQRLEESASSVRGLDIRLRDGTRKPIFLNDLRNPIH
jgi:hypothetical protein